MVCRAGSGGPRRRLGRRGVGQSVSVGRMAGVGFIVGVGNCVVAEYVGAAAGIPARTACCGAVSRTPGWGPAGTVFGMTACRRSVSYSFIFQYILEGAGRAGASGSGSTFTVCSAV